MKLYKPTSPGTRAKTGINYREILSGDSPYKPLVVGFQRAVGRNSRGRITTRHKGGGAKRNFRIIDFRYEKKNVPACVETIEYDPNRSGFIGRVLYVDGQRSYVLLPLNIRVGDKIEVREDAPLKVGNRLLLKNIPVGTSIYNIELKPGNGAQLVRSAGVWAQVMAHEGKYTQLKLPSSEIRRVLSTCWASIGNVSNPEYTFVSIGKAGRARHMGRRPTVRGTAMNAVDHPYGGGEGRQPRGTRRPKTRWGKITGGHKSRKKNKYSNSFIISRRKKK